MSTTTKALRTVTLVARYGLKRNHSVIYRLKNDAGNPYTVTINQGGRPACQDERGESCRGNSYGRTCYHVMACLKLEEARRKAAEDQDAAAYEEWKRQNNMPDRLDRAAYEQEFSIY